MKALKNSGGKAKSSSSKKARKGAASDPCCCLTYIKAKKCSDNSDVDLWFILNDDGTIVTDGSMSQALTYYFRIACVWYYVASGNTQGTPGTMASGYVDAALCPTHIQATKCIDGTTADLWRPVSSGVPYYFLKSSICYKMECGNPVSSSPGTILSGETSKTSCGTCQPCANCSPTTPYQIGVNLSGITLCATCTLMTGGLVGRVTSGSPDGSYILTRTSETSCQWEYSGSPSLTITKYNNGNCGGTVIATTTNPLHISVTRASGSWSILVEAINGDSSTSLLTGSNTSSDCSTATTITSSRPACGALGSTMGTSGTAVLTPL